MPARPLHLLPGTLDVLILKAVSWKAEHGFGIARAIEQRSDGGLLIQEGALYPALHRLERAGALKSSWQVTENGRRARYYELTDDGRARLRAEVRQWREYTGLVKLVLGPG